jgi:hypothetical protein
MDLIPFLLDLFGDLQVQRDRITQFLKGDCQMNQSTRDALQKVGDAITTEIEEIRTLVKNGSDSTEVDTALGNLATRISGISDAVTTVEGGGEVPPSNPIVTPDQ